MPQKHAVVKMLRADLTAARNEWIEQANTDQRERKRRSESGFLTYRDASGRVLDFHAFRHTFITNLARGGAHPKQAQDLARHSDINLTMSRYSHTLIADRAAALRALPDLSEDASGESVRRATGTEGRSLPTGLPTSLPRAVASEAPSIASDCTKTDVTDDRRNSTNPTGARVSSHPPSSLNTQFQRRRRDSNPRDAYAPNGFQDRRLQPLGHASKSFVCNALHVSGFFDPQPRQP